MKNIQIETKISINGKVQTFENLDNKYFSIDFCADANGIKAVLKPVFPMELVGFKVSFDYDFNPGDRFFGAGYQSWTTANEFTAGDIEMDITPLARGLLEHVAAFSADTEITGRYPKKPGHVHSITYTYIRNGEKMKLFGSLSERFGYTIFRADMNGNKLTIERDVKGAFVKGGEYTLLDVAVFEGGYDEVFDAYFAAMNIKKPKIDHLAGYTSWYNYFQKIDENIILRDLNGLDPVKDVVSIFQIDDGYAPYVGDWLDYCPKFPNGMKYIADKIHEKGYLAGIWLAPFNVQIKSRTYKEHPDWVVRDDNGRPILGSLAWGGAYTLDIYKPEVREHIRHFFDVVLNEWGFDMVKLDFLYSQCHKARNGRSKGQIMCEAVDFLRECCGDKLILGCGLPIGPAFGKVDACRISCDADLKYEGMFYNRMKLNNELPSAQNAINNTILRRHLNGRAFVNDPDVFFLRDNKLTYTREQKLLLATINNMFGNVLFVSDNAGDYDAEKYEIIRHMFKKSKIKVKMAEYIESDLIRITIDGGDKDKYFDFNIKTGKVYNNAGLPFFDD
jgi:alpha-galactosidase